MTPAPWALLLFYFAFRVLVERVGRLLEQSEEGGA